MDIPDVPLTNFGADTEVATPPVASPADEPAKDEQMTQPTEANGSEEPQPQTEKPADNPIAEEQKSGRPEKHERLQNRFSELTGRIKERDGEIEKLQAEIARAQAMGQVPKLQPNENGEYSVEAIQENQVKVAKAEAQAAMSQLRQQMDRESVASRFDNEARDILSSHKVLNPDNKDEYDPVIAEAVEEAINLAVSSNLYNVEALKQISPKAIADKIMKGYESAGRRAQSAATKNVQSLQAEQAVTPLNAPQTPDEDEALLARVADIKF